jgi:hypothetical protein
LGITRLTIFYSDKQAPVRINYGTIKSYIFSFNISCDRKLIQYGNRKEEKMKKEKNYSRVSVMVVNHFWRE